LASVVSPSGRYFAMNSRHSFMSGASLKSGSVGSFRYWEVITPSAFSGPAGVMVEAMEAETLDMMCSGFQPMSNALRITWAENFGIAPVTSTSAPLSFIVTTWLSTVASDAS
jgi:hypothetical protein